MRRDIALIGIFVTSFISMFVLALVAQAQPTADPQTVPVRPAHDAVQPADRLDQDRWQQRNELLDGRVANGGGDLVFLGDSITEGWENSGREVWQQFYGDRNALNLGIGGDRTQHVLWRIEHGQFGRYTPKLIVLMIGTNNLPDGRSTPEETIEGIQAVVARLREKQPESHILLLGVFPRGAQPDDPLRIRVAQVNVALSHLADWDHIHYFDIGHIFLEADRSLSPAVMPDALHLSPEGYRRWAQAIEFKVAELLGEPQSGQVSLFDGESFTGWKAGDQEGPPQGWGIVDGRMAVVGPGTDAETIEHYENFDLQCEWMLEHRGNSGIFYRWADYGGFVSVGPEYQLIDDLGRRLRPTLKDALAANTHLYGPPPHKPVREAGTWNHARIVANGDDVEHWLNGVRVLSIEMNSQDWKDRVADSMFAPLTPFGILRRGTIRLQNHAGSPAYYREVKIRVLP